MEAGAGCRGGADGRTGIRSQSISVRYHVLGEERWGVRRRASGHGRRGGQARRRDATRDAAACGSSGGGAGKHGRDVRRTIGRCAGGRQQHGAGRGPITTDITGPILSAVALSYSMGFNIPIHTPLRSVLGIIICNSDNKLLKMVPNTRYFITLY